MDLEARSPHSCLTESRCACLADVRLKERIEPVTEVDALKAVHLAKDLALHLYQFKVLHAYAHMRQLCMSECSLAFTPCHQESRN